MLSLTRIVGTCLLLAAGIYPVYAQSQNVTLSATPLPVRLIIKEIEAKTGCKITTDKYLAEKKIYCLVEKVSVEDLLNRVAAVHGGTCRKGDNNGVATYDLAVRPDVKAWVAFYDTGRADAKRRAANDLADIIYEESANQRQQATDADKGKTNPSGVLALSRFFPDAAWRSLAQAQANGLATSYTLQTPGDAPIWVIKSDALNANERTVLHDILNKPYLRNVAEAPVQYVTLYLDGGSQPAIGVTKYVYGDGLVSRGMYGAVPSKETNWRWERVTKESEYLSQRLVKHPQPAAARLDLPADQSVRWDTAADDAKAFPVSGKKLSCMDVLTDLHRVFHLNVVADFYTDPKRIEAKSDAPNSVLQASADTFHTLYRRDGEWLLSSHNDFAERSYQEAPYPLFEQCIDWQRQRRNTYDPLNPMYPPPDRPMPIDTILPLGTLTHEQFVTLAEYRDPEENIAFPSLFRMLEFLNSYHFGNERLGYLNNIGVKRLMAVDGVPVSSLPAPFQSMLRHDAGMSTFLDTHWSGAALRLVYRAPNLNAGELDTPGWWLQIVWPDDPKQLIEFDKIDASPPEANTKALLQKSK